MATIMCALFTRGALGHYHSSVHPILDPILHNLNRTVNRMVMVLVRDGDWMVMVLVRDGDWMVMVLVGDGDWMLMVLVGDGDWMLMVLVGDGNWMVMVLVGDGDWMVMVSLGDGDWRLGGHPEATVLLSFIYFHCQCLIHFRSERPQRAWGELCCSHSFIFNVNMSFISTVRVAGGPGGMVLLPVNYFQRQCVIHFKSDGHCCMGFLVSAFRQRLFGFFKLNFSLIFNLFNFFAGFFNGLHTCFNVSGTWV